MAADNTATFALRIDADTEASAEAATELERFRNTIVRSQSALADYKKSLALLKGSSDEVRDAKEKLRAAVEAETGKIVQANLGILRLGGSFDRLSKAVRKSSAATSDGKKAIATVGGPVKELSERMGQLKELLPALATGWGAVAGSVALTTAAIALAATAVAGLLGKLTSWLVASADANRNLALQREAFSGSTKNATAWGHIIDWASEKTALTTSKLNEMVIATEKSLRGFRVSGQGMVDAFKATSLAAGAGREDVAEFFKELVERGKATGRSAIQFPDLARFRNAGIDAKKVFAELGIKANASTRGAIVPVDKLAAALARLSENRFAQLNEKKMLSLGAQWDRLRDNVQRFTSDLAGEGGALEPLLRGLQQVTDLFDLSTQSGQDLKKAITAYGTAIATAIVAHIPDIKAFAIAAIKVGAAFIEGAAAVARFAQSDAGILAFKVTLGAAAAAAVGLGVAIGAVVALAAQLAVPFVAFGAAIVGVKGAVDRLRAINWAELGTAIGDGIKAGLLAGVRGLENVVTSMGEGMKNAFTRILQIASPSRVFERYGFQTGQGAARGADRSSALVATASSGMAEVAATAGAPSASAGAGGGASSGGPITITVENHFNIGAGANAEQVKAALTSSSFLEGFELSLRRALQTQGLVTRARVASGG